MSKQFIERRIAIGLITNEKYLREISPVFDQDLLKDEAAKKLLHGAFDIGINTQKPHLKTSGLSMNHMFAGGNSARMKPKILVKFLTDYPASIKNNQKIIPMF